MNDLRRLEAKVERMKALQTRLYQTFYAAQIRRSNTYGAMLSKVKRSISQMTKDLPNFYRLSRIAALTKQGKSVVALTPREIQLLKAMLKRQKPYKPRRK